MEKPSSFYYFKTKPIILPSKYDLWRGVADSLSRVRTPKDNPEAERFNQTLEYEWLYDSNLTLDPAELNPRLTEWLIEYNFNRPHETLDYLTPIEYTEKELIRIRGPSKVLPIWSASTGY